jgi:flagellar biosynthesis protein FlhF
MVSVTAAVEEQDEEPITRSFTPQKPSNGKAQAQAITTAMQDELRHDIQATLRFHNVPDLFIAKLMQKANDRKMGALSLENLLAAFFQFAPLSLDASTRLMLVGTPGIGKTLTIAKMATRICMENPSAKREMAVITTDNKRAGGVEQLRAFTDILGIHLLVAGSIGELRAHIDDTGSRAPLLIDTAGCNPYDADELQELKTYCNLGIEPILAMQAGGDSMEAIDMVELFVELPIKRILITRADTARRFGGVLACAAAHGLALCNASSSASIVDSLQPLTAKLLAQFLLRYKASHK